jgi:ATP-dependent DNA helicase DinG
VGGVFDFWERETGISPEERVCLGSPFDLPSQMSIWVVELGLRVTERGYDEMAGRVIERLCDDNGGRTLVVCSSRRLVNAVSTRMKGKKRAFRVLCQGEAPKGELLNLFRNDETSVLIGSLSFREGIDIPGEGLTQVILDRIPFPHPEDPLVRARRDLEGSRTFIQSILPMSRLFLRQAFGRLIRRKTDIGRVVILDGRALDRPDWGILQDFQGVSLRRIRLAHMP